MRRVALLVAVCALGVVAHAGPTYRGVALTPWSKDALASKDCDKSIRDAKAAGTNIVAINIWWFQDNKKSTVISEDFSRYTSTEVSVRHAIRQSRQNHMKVALKPLVDLRDQTFRGELIASPAWFESYRNFITHWAKVAQQEKVDLYCVGTELDNTISEEAEWRKTIAAVRKEFKGPLTYATNFGFEDKVRWWDALDLIGIDAYYALTKKKDPTLAELKGAWNVRARLLEAWLKELGLNKQILFTEAGYRSADGTNSSPWMWGDKPKVDLQEQIDCYNAMFGTLWNRPWWAGLFLWNWEVNPKSGGPKDFGYTPQNKPSLAVLKRWYTSK